MRRRLYVGQIILNTDLSRAYRVADKLDAGNIWINSYNLIPPDWPFGGVKQSGFGNKVINLCIRKL